ncbi:MAG: glycerophosphodiester phosphodiesterase family protein [Vibrio gallaecicus]
MSPIIVGHRGVSGTHPENTRASIQNAIDLGLSWIEVDIQPTKDDVLVICHDHNLERCSDGKGRLDEHTLAELKQLDFGSWFSSEFAGEQILTLSELLELAEHSKLQVNLEIKIDTHDPAHVVALLAQELASTTLPSSQLLLSSFSHDVIEELAQHCSQFRIGLITESLSNQDKAALIKNKAFSCHLNYQNLTNEQLDYLTNLGFEVWCYTVNHSDTFPLMNKVNAIFTDFPTRFTKTQ